MASKQLWRWHGITGDGNAQDGMLWAESRALLLMALQQQMVTPLSLKRIAINSAQWRGDKSAEVIHQLATLLKAGLTLSEGLALLAEQHPSKQWQALLQSLAHDLEQGIAFSNALLPWSEVFPPLYQAMIRTGELTGKLDECCFELARQQKAQRQLTEKVKSALRYPIIILAMAIMVVVAMLHFVLPEFAAIYKTFNTPLPALTQGIMTLADFSGEWGWLLVLFGFLLAIANKLLMRRPTAYRAAEIVVTNPDYGFTDEGTKTHADLYDSGADTKCRHYFFTGRRERQRNNALPVLGATSDTNPARYQ